MSTKSKKQRSNAGIYIHAHLGGSSQRSGLYTASFEYKRRIPGVVMIPKYLAHSVVAGTLLHHSSNKKGKREAFALEARLLYSMDG